MYLFSKKIKCLKCNGNFRGITERGKRKYYCSTYHNYRTCTRYKIDEDELVDLTHNHYEIILIKNMIGIGRTIKEKEKNKDGRLIEPTVLAEYVKVINVDPDSETIEIIYQDNTFTKITPDRQIF